jgi:N-methylhydantoinase A/oxoprolinase/acetone carboxylase beta subunit
MVNARLAAYGVVMKPEPEPYRSASARLNEALIERRDVWFDRAPLACPVYDREKLPERAQLAGPAIVEEFGATTVLPPGWRATVDALGNLLMALM